MRIVPVIGLVAALAAAAPAHADLLPTVKVRTAECRTSLSQDERSAVFEGDMRGVRGAARLQVKFSLQARTDERPQWTRVQAPGFGTWNTADPGVARYVYTKTVENLPAPASYRAVVHFRWLKASGKPLLELVRNSPVCRETDLRPDLVPDHVMRIGDGSSADTKRYAVWIRNDGLSAANAFIVTMQIGGSTFPLASLPSLDAGDLTRVEGEGPACRTDEPIVVTIDGDDQVDEADEDSNVLEDTCPPSADR